MTENKEMTIEEALELAVESLNSRAKNLSDMPYSNLSSSARKYESAAAVLRQIGEPVERSEVVKRCVFCSRKLHTSVRMCHHCGWSNENAKYQTKSWTETPVLKRAIKKSAPVYEPVDTKNEG